MVEIKNLRICYGKNDMWVEEYREIKSKKDGKEKSRTGWIRCSGYHSRYDQLIESYHKYKSISIGESSKDVDDFFKKLKNHEHKINNLIKEINGGVR